MTASQLVRLAFDEVHPSPDFGAWLAEQRLSIAMTKGNSLWFIGSTEDGELVLSERNFGTCMGLAAPDSQTLYLATRYQIWRLENALPEGQTDEAGHDRLFLPQMAWTTGALLVRDLDVMADGRVIFVNGLFSCVSTTSNRLNFDPLWLPPFISGLAPEDRCHLSGVAVEEDHPGFVTSASRSDRPAGWREQMADGGLIMSVQAGEVVAEGLSMPCSPILTDGRVWLCNAGAGEIATVEVGSGAGDRLAALPGFTRGLALTDRVAVVATSRPHRGENFAGLPLADRLAPSEAEGRCGIFVVDLESGRVEHSLLFFGGSGEIQALRLLDGVASATAVPFTGHEVQELVSLPALGGSPDGSG